MNTPHSETVALEGGGDLTFSWFPDGDIRVAYEKDGIRQSFGLTLTDGQAARSALISTVSVAERAEEAPREYPQEMHDGTLSTPEPSS